MTKFFKRLTSRLTGNDPVTPPPEPQRGSSIQPRVGTPVPTLGSCPNNPINPERVESHPNSKFSPRSTGQNPQSSTLEDLNYNRNGKIARLPRDLRDRINLALYNRCTAKDLARALNQMPEVQAVLAQSFNGRPLKRQNIDEWKHGGYRDWLHHRQLLEQQRELAADAKDLSDTADGAAESLFGILTLNYADLLMNRDKETPEEFEKKRKELSLVSQDISRMHRCHINTRRVEVQEARLERDEEKTTEQLHFKFMEWVENPAIRRACILEPMEANRRSRQHFGMPPTSDDILVEKLTRNDPYFNPPNKKPAKSKPKPAQKSHPDAKPSPPSEPQGGSSIQPGVGTPVPIPGSDPDDPLNPEGVEAKPSDPSSAVGTEAKPSQPSNPYGDKTTSQIIAEIEGQRDKPASPSPKDEGELKTDSPIRHISPIPSNSKLSPRSTGQNPQTPSLPKPPLSDYERALLEGKTFLEALYIHSTPAKPNSQPASPPARCSAWDSFSQPVDVYSGFRSASDNFGPFRSISGPLPGGRNAGCPG